MELTHNSTHRSAMIASFWQTFNAPRPTTNSNRLLDSIYVDMRQLNSTLPSTPRWIYGSALSSKYSKHSATGGVQYKQAIGITILEIVILLLTVVFVLFITGHFQNVKWTCQLICGINEHLNCSSSKKKIAIKDRKQLKLLLKLSSLSSAQMKSVEKLIFMKLKVTRDNYWTTYNNQQQNIIIAFAYISAIQSTTGINSSSSRSKLKLIRPNVNPQFQYDDDKNKPSVETTSELPDSSLDVILEQFPKSDQSYQIIECVMEEIENTNIQFRKNDDNYNVGKFYEIMQKIDNKIHQIKIQMNNHNSKEPLYDQKYADLFVPFNQQEEKSQESTMDLSFEAQLAMIDSEPHRKLVLRISEMMKNIEATIVVQAYYNVKNVYGTEDIEAMGTQIVNYCLGK